jgi:hypothetical protein
MRSDAFPAVDQSRLAAEADLEMAGNPKTVRGLEGGRHFS